MNILKREIEITMEQQVGKSVTQIEGRLWDKIEQVELLENRDRWRGLVVRCPT
jgi:hypothetical protein